MSLKLWHISALVFAGVGVGVLIPNRLTALFPVATLYVFLPALIFEAAWQLDLRIMAREWRPIALLAFPGVIVTAAVVGGIVHFALGLPIGAGLLLGAILSATDPVAVVSIFRRLPIPKTLATIVESEALLNDAVAVVLYRMIITTLIFGVTTAGGIQIAAQAGLGSLAGILLGVAFAFVSACALRARIPAWLQVAATFVAAYAAYVTADRLNWSGIFAVVALGVTLHVLERRLSPVQRAFGVSRAWQSAATIANALLFFLIGTALDVRTLTARLAIIGLTLFAIVLARTLLDYGGLALIQPRIDSRWRTVIRFAGVRGALSLALALALPLTLPQRSIIIDSTFAVVIVTIVIATLTLSGRIRKLDLMQP